jgi:aspartate-semialdehyde dehydrogenase
VFSNAKDNRRAKGIPLVITEVNAAHFKMLDDQKGNGFVVTNGNCSGIVATLAMAPLHRAFGIEAAHIVTLQALSGAGYPGVSSLDIMDNLVPFIGGEEDKLEKEPQHQLGDAHADGSVTPAPFPISSTCTRVAVIEGHSMAIHLKVAGDPSVDDVRGALLEQVGLERLDLPSAPRRAVQLLDADNRPQPRRDRDAGKGMTVSVGRVRADPLMSVKLFASGSNTIRGAAGQSILNAEYALANGYV